MNKKIICLLLVGCGSNNSNNNIDDNQKDKVTVGKLKDINLEWCQLYNPNGFDTLACIITNPNSVDVDVSYDLVFYKDGKKIAYAKKFAEANVDILNKIKTNNVVENTTQLVSKKNISQNEENVNNNKKFSLSTNSNGIKLIQELVLLTFQYPYIFLLNCCLY